MQMRVMRLLRGLTAPSAAAAALAMAAPASAQLYLNDPGFAKGAIEGSDPLVGIPIPGATPAEYRAHLLWNLRAGLNVAALQCQFSPYLRSVSNYNSILAHHNVELAAAYTALNGYFKRTQGSVPKGQKAFDDYTTSTYNNFSTLQAQYGFCQTASNIAKEALTRPKGQFHLTAEQRMRELRGSLVAVTQTSVAYAPQLISMPVLPPLEPDCYDRKNRLKDKCAAQYGLSPAVR
jgi:hypothetical protein